jgi:predicted transglutaminase-like cysteine proteinase
MGFRLAPRLKRRLSAYVLIGATALSLGLATHSAANFDKLLSTLTQRWGNAPVPKFQAWRALVASVAGAQDPERLKKINDFFNRQMQFGNDPDVWGEPDYWATPMESIGKGAGDCEDFVIAKYFSLLEAGVSSEKLRLIYVRVRQEGAPLQAHMVLGYYPQPEAEPLVLDNLIGDIRAAGRRSDLVPVFSFNKDGVYSGVSAKDSGPAAGVGRLSRWEDLLKRARAEGFE